MHEFVVQPGSDEDDNDGKESSSQSLTHYHLLDASDINQLQRIYPEIVKDLNESFTRLKKSNCSWKMAKLEEKNVLKLLSSIKPLITVKNSIFLQRGLEPTIFSLLFEILPLADQWVLTSLPDLHYMLMQLAKCFSNTHEYFLSSSDLFKTATVYNGITTISSCGPLSADRTACSNYFVKILNSLTKLFGCFSILSNHAQSVLIDWLNQITIAIGDQFQAFLQLNDIFLLRSALLLEPFFTLYLLKSQDIRKTLVKSIYKFHVFNLLLSDEARCKELTQKFITKLCNYAEKLEVEQFRIIWTRIPISFLIRLFGLLDATLQFQTAIELPASPATTLQLGRMHIEAYEFQLIANFIFDRKCIFILQDSSTARNWIGDAIEFLFKNISMSSEEDRKMSPIFDEESKKQRTPFTMLQKWLFIISKFAQYCVVNRMKTPIGKTPLETFTKFEGELRALLSSCSTRKPPTIPDNDSLQKNVPPEDEEEEDDDESLPTRSDDFSLNRAIRNLRPEEEWLRVRMLLHCVDMVEKMMCYAVRGSMLRITEEIPLNARQFFCVNYNTCMDWLTRTTLPLMGVAFANGYFAQIVRLGGYLITEIERKFLLTASEKLVRIDSFTQQALCWIVRALVRLGAPQAIIGVRAWAQSLFENTHSFEWCHFAELLASARVEEALDGFLNILHSTKQSDRKHVYNEHVLSAVEEMALDAAKILRSPYLESRIRESINFTANMKSFEAAAKRERWQRILNLASWDQLSVPPNLTVLSPVEHKKEFWELNGRLLDFETDILRLYEIRQQSGSFNRLNTSETLFTIQDELSDLSQFLIFGGHMQTDGLEHSKLAVLHAVCTGIQHLNHQHHHQQPYQQRVNQQYHQHNRQMRSPTKHAGQSPILLEFDFNALLSNYKVNSLHRLELGQMYYGWMHRLYGTQKENHYALNKMQGNMAQLAQNLGNTQFACNHGYSAYGMGTSTAEIIPEHHQLIAFSQAHMQQNPLVFDAYHLPAPAPKTFAIGSINPSTASDSSQASNSVPMQFLLSEEFDGDKLRLLPNESSVMLQYGIDICTEQGAHFEELIGRYATYDEFRAHVNKKFPITDISMQASAILMAIELPTFNQLWLAIKHRQYRLYELALNSHLRFLENLTSGKSHIQTIEVILRLLKMLARQPEWFERIIGSAIIGLSDDKHNWMDRISIDVWLGVITQLFAYLNHSNTYVNNTVRILLEKIGTHAPHAICYPAIVIIAESRDQGGFSEFFDSLLITDHENLDDRTESENNNLSLPLKDLKNIDNILDVSSNLIQAKSEAKSQRLPTFHKNIRESCKALIQTLTTLYPELVKDTIEFCRDLRRIALLNEEKWLYVLTQFDHQIMRLLRVTPFIEMSEANNDFLQNGRSSPVVNQRFSSFMEKVLISLNSLNALTCLAKLESDNERQFYHLFSEQILNALEIFKQNMHTNPKLAWEPFKKLIGALNKQALKRSSLCLNMPKISDYLGHLSSTKVPIPGQEMRRFSEVITLQKVGKIVFVLPTKTRPKKLNMTGSDGKTYTFLFKGQENLYMDTRLMQFLQICNSLFEDPKNSRQMDMLPSYHCTSYSVTPLGYRSGLIEWVEGAIPLFQIYRKWRIRQVQFRADADTKVNKIQKLTASPGRSASQRTQRKWENPTKLKRSEEPEPERPMEQFYNKLRALFTAERIPKEHFTDRKHWPKKTIKKVIKELIDETPKDILAKELWMHAESSDKWWDVTQRFARTVAVSSMLGTLIGLGDRHLDNVLINLHNGQIVHVDYNVCFGKGRSLRVPETVPFRLTGNIVDALGPTKIEGTFRQSSERVLEILRTDKHVLLQLLETLKFDAMPDLNFLQNTTELKNMNQQEIADYVVQGIRRKLEGYEIRRNNAQSARSSPGIINLAACETNKEQVEKDQKPDWSEIGPMSVPEQVNLLLQEATSLDNLALMYEGWTAWVLMGNMMNIDVLLCQKFKEQDKLLFYSASYAHYMPPYPSFFSNQTTTINKNDEASHLSNSFPKSVPRISTLRFCQMQICNKRFNNPPILFGI